VFSRIGGGERRHRVAGAAAAAAGVGVRVSDQAIAVVAVNWPNERGIGQR
jgi:hypothetical protein